LFDWIVAAIAVHVAAAFFYLWVRRENLIVPMITGQKNAANVPAGAGIDGSRIGIALLLLVIVGGLLFWLVSSAPEASLYVF
jgi:cytochrome b561